MRQIFFSLNIDDFRYSFMRVPRETRRKMPPCHPGIQPTHPFYIIVPPEREAKNFPPYAQNETVMNIQKSKATVNEQ